MARFGKATKQARGVKITFTKGAESGRARVEAMEDIVKRVRGILRHQGYGAYSFSNRKPVTFEFERVNNPAAAVKKLSALKIPGVRGVRVTRW